MTVPRAGHSLIKAGDPDATSDLIGLCRICGGLSNRAIKCVQWTRHNLGDPVPHFAPDEMISIVTASPNLTAILLGNGASHWHGEVKGDPDRISFYRRHRNRFDPDVVLNDGLKRFLLGGLPVKVVKMMYPELVKRKLAADIPYSDVRPLSQSFLNAHGRAVARLLRLGKSPGPQFVPWAGPILSATATLSDRQIVEAIHAMEQLSLETSVARGWHHDRLGQPKILDFPLQVALMHTELSEALEGDRKGLMDDKLPHRDAREVELADLMLRIMNVSAAMGLDVAGAFIEKNHYNLTRSDHDADKREDRGQKRY